MISVPNRQQLLSGSKIFTLLFIVLVFFSCDPTKKARSTSPQDMSSTDIIKSRTKKNKTTGKTEIVTDVTGKMDTVKWRNDNSVPAITSNPDDYNEKEEEVETVEIVPTRKSDADWNESQKSDTYRIAVMLPFDAQKSFGSSVPKSAESVLDFYGGMKMAIDQLNRENIPLSISILDTQKSKDVTKALLNSSELVNADVIIGPTSKSLVAIVQKFAMENKKVMISPTYPSGKLATNNPFFVQVSPSLVSHCEAITQHLLESYSSDQVVLVAKEGSETKRFRYFQTANNKFAGEGRMKEYSIQSELADFDEIDFSELIIPDKTTVFVMPSWSDEKFVNNFMRMVSIAKGQSEVVMYGMPQWINFSNIDFDYYRRLNVHVSSASFVDKYSLGGKDFRRDFFNKFGKIPLDDAFKGYDILLYTGRMLNKHGNKFQQYLDKEEDQYNHTKFSFQPVTKARKSAEDYSINKFENKYVNILKFEDYQFKLAK